MGKEILITQFYNHPIENVWEAISTSEALAEWLMPNDFKLEKGYEFTFQTKPQLGFDGKVKCKVLDFFIPTRLQFSWQGGPMKKPTVVTFDLATENEGTLLTFRQSGFEGFISKNIIRFILANGWKSLVNKKIAKYLADE